MKAFTQCTSTFEVIAGPDIEVCEEGSVYLEGIIGGGATKAVWRGGKGEFIPGRNALKIEYIPDTSEAGTTIVLILVASNPELKDCPAERDEVKLSVNMMPKVSAGNNMIICDTYNATLKGSLVSGQAKRTYWKSTGTGKFENPNKLNTTYVPSANDVRNGGCVLKLFAEPLGVCLPDSDAIALTILPTPVLTIAAEKYAEKKNVNLSLQGTTKGDVIIWTTSGSGTFAISENTAAYTPSASEIEKGSADIKAALQKGDCVIEKSITIDLTNKTNN